MRAATSRSSRATQQRYPPVSPAVINSVSAVAARRPRTHRLRSKDSDEYLSGRQCLRPAASCVSSRRAPLMYSAGIMFSCKPAIAREGRTRSVSALPRNARCGLFGYFRPFPIEIPSLEPWKRENEREKEREREPRLIGASHFGVSRATHTEAQRGASRRCGLPPQRTSARGCPMRATRH